MESPPNTQNLRIAPETLQARRKPVADYVYQLATLAAALLLLLTATV
jgi:hypothetical protein